MTRFFIAAWENIKIAITTLRTNKLRSLLTTLGIMIGVLTVIAVASIITGLNKAFMNQISAIGSSTLYVQKMPWMAGMDYFKYRNRPDITLRDVENVMDYCKTAWMIAPSTRTRQTLKWGNRVLEDVTITGTTLEGLEIEGLIPERGRLFSSIEVDTRKPMVVIGAEVASRLFGKEDPLGKRMKIGPHRYYVIGILEKRGSMFGHSMDTELFIPIGAFFKSFGFQRSLTIQVKVHDPAQLESTKEELEFIMRRSHKLRPAQESDFSINQQDALTNVYKQLTTGLYSAAFGIGILSLLVGGIGIMNIMLVSVSERTREIGIRKALGASNSMITGQFIIEAVVICLIGGFIGIILGFGMSELIRSTTPFPSSVPVSSIFIGLGFSSAVGLFFGIYPARKAAKLDPIDALRWE